MMWAPVALTAAGGPAAAIVVPGGGGMPASKACAYGLIPVACAAMPESMLSMRRAINGGCRGGGGIVGCGYAVGADVCSGSGGNGTDVVTATAAGSTVSGSGGMLATGCAGNCGMTTVSLRGAWASPSPAAAP